MNPKTLEKLNSLPGNAHKMYKPAAGWPKGTRQELSKRVANRFFSLVSTCDTSLVTLLRAHPELPPWNQLDSWRRHHIWFKEGLARARRAQAHYLANKCLDIAKAADPKTAHVARVQFDIYRWFAARVHPDAYADKPAHQQQQTNVQIGVSVSPERLTEIRAKLEQTRNSFRQRTAAVVETPKRLPAPSIPPNGSHEPSQPLNRI